MKYYQNEHFEVWLSLCSNSPVRSLALRHHHDVRAMLFDAFPGSKRFDGFSGLLSVMMVLM